MREERVKKAGERERERNWGRGRLPKKDGETALNSEKREVSFTDKRMGKWKGGRRDGRWTDKKDKASVPYGGSLVENHPDRRINVDS